ncbi:uncharacterized protein LOC109713119 [Ananas comosus]|uniref:Uncharacterized protein LOC109713119 n=1 Tax=Ananas comosus TaxID=4615 RepID=A0A6P5F9P7_ANACO|nr:uncharacterized protein LOC109713119 [Ananas comosus]
MEKKQGFFSALREEVARGLSPGRARSESPGRAPSQVARLFRPRRWKERYYGAGAAAAEVEVVPRYGGMRGGGGGGGGETLAPLMEGPDPGEGEEWRKEGWARWVKGHLARATSVSGGGGGGGGGSGAASSGRRSDLRLLLGVMGAPLAPIHVCAAEPLPHLSIKDTPIETSSAQYILQQYTAACGGVKLLSSIRNSYAMGKVKMVATEFESANKIIKNRHAMRSAESGGFVLWQMAPEMWYVEIVVGGSKVHAGCNGQLVWRHTPWLGAHAAKGPVRPLRRALQGLDPLTTASMFANARCIGEKKVNGEDCFILKLSADPQTLQARSEGPAEVIRHALFGYFSQRTGLLVHIEDSHLTRIQSNTCGDAVYWETTISSFIEDYRPIDGMMIAHSGRSQVTLFRFGEVAMSHTKTRMEEAWTIEEVAFNVAGLSVDCFIPPSDIKYGSIGETLDVTQGERGKTSSASSRRAKVAALERPD